MSRYVITINTDAYKPLKADEKNWERGTVNDFMKALNGYKVTETSLKGVKRRVKVFVGHNGCEEDESVNEYFDWLENPKSKARITFYDTICGFECTENVSPYGFKQGYLDVEKVIETLRTKGTVIIPFDSLYDIRQASAKYFKGCYMEIVKK